MNRNKFIDHLLEKGQCNRFSENNIDAIEQFCFTLFDNINIEKIKLEQQAIGVVKATDVREINWSQGDRSTLLLLAEQLRARGGS